jgi:hypothetical protein
MEETTTAVVPYTGPRYEIDLARLTGAQLKHLKTLQDREALFRAAGGIKDGFFKMLENPLGMLILGTALIELGGKIQIGTVQQGSWFDGTHKGDPQYLFSDYTASVLFGIIGASSLAKLLEAMNPLPS